MWRTPHSTAVGTQPSSALEHSRPLKPNPSNLGFKLHRVCSLATMELNQKPIAVIWKTSKYCKN
jgi:hypothetical protein